jgi:Pyruvate/2-oxoacid:ferredoxin oxidoreductase gamma subunit
MNFAAQAITEQTGLAIGLVIAIITAIVGCTYWLSNRLSSIDSRLSRLEENHYTVAEAEAHALRLALENPSINVPDPRNPGELLRVGGHD